LGNGDGTFGAEKQYDKGGDYSVSVDVVTLGVGDFNKDGFPDLAVARSGSNPSPSSVAILLGKGDGTLGAPTVVATAVTVDGISVSDLNRDGALDIVFDADVPPTGHRLYAILGNGRGGFSPQSAIVNISEPLENELVLDLNGDGIPDIAYTAVPSHLYVMIGNGDGSFASPVDYSNQPNCTTASGTALGSCLYPLSYFAVADLNRDQKPDLIFFGGQGTTVGPGIGVSLNTTGVIPTPSGAFAHIAAGGDWATAVTITNTSAIAVTLAVSFHADDGSSLTLPLTATAQGNEQSLVTNTVSATISPHASLLITTGQLPSTVVGWASITSSGSVSGYAIFQATPQSGGSSEGTAPFQAQFSSILTMPFDNTIGFVTGVALANLANSSAQVTATMWDDSGNALGTQTFTIPSGGHTSFALPSQIASTAGKRGTVQFQSTAVNGIIGIGLRFSPLGTFTSVPVF